MSRGPRVFPGRSLNPGLDDVNDHIHSPHKPSWTYYLLYCIYGRLSRRCDLLRFFKLSFLSPSHFLPRLRPRIRHIRAQCSPGSNCPGRAAYFQTRSPLRSWYSHENATPQAKQEINTEKEANQDTTHDQKPFEGLRSPVDFYRAQPVLDRRIHIIGLGSVGQFIAHSLRSIPNPPPVTLLFSGWDKLNAWKESPQRLQLITGDSTEARGGYDAELYFPRRRFHKKEVQSKSNTASPLAQTPGEARYEDERPQAAEGESTEPIHSLIVCTKAPYVLQALSAVKHRLHKESVICFMQNGMGIVEEVDQEIFPDPETRPHYMLGINSHGMHSIPSDTFTTVHAGFGTISLGLLPHERNRKPAPYEPTQKFKPSHTEPVTLTGAASPDPEAPSPTTAKFKWTTNQRYLLRVLLRTPVLGATAFSPPDLLQLQLEKLAVNCIVNSLTVMLDARNGAILYNYSLTRVMRLLLSEISLVIRSLPELQYIPNVQQRFDPGRLESIVVGVAHRTRDNISSMLADVRGGRQTEINYINGWIVKKGEEQGVQCFMNYMLMHLVRGKGNMVQLEMEDSAPFVGERRGEGGLRTAEKIAMSGEEVKKDSKL